MNNSDIIELVIALRYERLSATDQLVLLWHHAHADGLVSWSSRAMIAHRLDLLECNVRRAELQLQDAGLLKLIGRHGGRSVRLTPVSDLMRRSCDPLTGQPVLEVEL